MRGLPVNAARQPASIIIAYNVHNVRFMNFARARVYGRVDHLSSIPSVPKDGD